MTPEQTAITRCGGVGTPPGLDTMPVMTAMTTRELLAGVGMDGELPRRADVGSVFDEMDFQVGCLAYLWALPLVSYAQWRTQHYDVFGAISSDLVQYVSYRDRLGLITANATTPYILGFFDLGETGPLVDDRDRLFLAMLAQLG